MRKSLFKVVSLDIRCGELQAQPVAPATGPTITFTINEFLLEHIRAGNWQITEKPIGVTGNISLYDFLTKTKPPRAQPPPP